MNDNSNDNNNNKRKRAASDQGDDTARDEVASQSHNRLVAPQNSTALLSLRDAPPRGSTQPQLVQFLKGKVLRIPNLKVYFPDWPVARSDLYDKLRAEMKVEISDEWIESERQRNVAWRADPALLASYLWPQAGYEELKVLTWFVTWQGYWDDVAEKMAEQGSDANASRRFRDSTKVFIMEGFSMHTRHTWRFDYDKMHECVILFEVIADCLAGGYDQSQRHALYLALKAYIDNAAMAARLLKGPGIPTWDNYWRCRLVTGDFSPLIAMTEFAYKFALDPEILDSTEFKMMKNSVSIIVRLINDLFSLKKELVHHPGLRLHNGDQVVIREPKQGCPVSAVPIIMLDRQVNLDQAVADIIWIIYNAVGTFKLAEHTLRVQWNDDADLLQAIAGLKHICTGFYQWSMVTDRYEMSEFVLADGGFECML